MTEPASASPREVLAASAARFPDSDALHIPLAACAHYADTGITFSYRELDSCVQAATAAWSDAGPQGRIALVLENRPEFFIHWLALNALGIGVIPINHEMADDEIPYYLEHGEAVAVVALAQHLQRFTDITRGLAAPIPVVAADAVADLQLGPVRAPEGGSPDTECALLYTSGSTGKPKGLSLIHI